MMPSVVRWRLRLRTESNSLSQVFRANQICLKVSKVNAAKTDAMVLTDVTDAMALTALRVVPELTEQREQWETKVARGVTEEQAQLVIPAPKVSLAPMARQGRQGRQETQGRQGRQET